MPETINNPKVTVYITSYNYRDYLAGAIDSALNQTYRDFEVIVIDDGSEDGSQEVIRRYEGNPRVRIIFQENQGLNRTNNVAIHAARGKYVMRLDADDYLDENALLVMATYLDNHPDVALVFPDYFLVDKAGTVIGQERRHDFNKEVTLRDQPAHGACTMIRKVCLMEVGLYSTQFTCQDGYDLWLKVIERYEVGNVNLPLFFYRRHGENLTEDSERLLKTRAEIYQTHAERTQRPSLKVVGVLPVRGRQADPNCLSLVELGGKPLIHWTIDAVLASGSLETLIVSSSDTELLASLRERYGERIAYFERPPELARENVSDRETVIAALDARTNGTPPPDAVMILNFNSPFRSAFYVDKAIDVMRVFDVPVVLAVATHDGHFYRHDGSGLHPVGTNGLFGKLRLEGDYLYRMAGGLILARYDTYLDPEFGARKEAVGHIILSRKASVMVMDAFDLAMAKAVLDL